jgi:hypothetical protein
MATDSDVARVLRDELHAHATTDALPERVLTDSLTLGRHSVRRRRRRVLAGSVAALAVAVVTAGVAVRDGSGAPEPAPSPPTTTPSPHPSGTVPSGAWAGSLPRGEAPEVPYLAGTTVVLPDGTRVDTRGSGAGVVGLTVAGLVVLVGTETPEGYPFSSHYALVTAAGELRELPVSTLTADGALEAVVSPDGRYFTAGHDVLDMEDLSSVGRVPEEAEYLLSWTPAGILYAVHDGRYFLWSQESGSRPLEAYPGRFANGTDIGLKHCSVVRLTSAGTTTPLSSCIEGVRSVSPAGGWALTRDLRLVEVATGRSRFLAQVPVDPRPSAYDTVWWDGETSLLFPVGVHLVRCDTATATCERATDGTELRDGVLALP